jgi:hypothetical protein
MAQDTVLDLIFTAFMLGIAVCILCGKEEIQRTEREVIKVTRKN